MLIILSTEAAMRRRIGVCATCRKCPTVLVLALPFLASPALAASLTLGCSGTVTTTSFPKGGVAGDAEKESIVDWSVAVDSDERTVSADSDEAGHAFQSEAGHLFRSEAGRGSDLMSATLRRAAAGRWDDVFLWLLGQADGSGMLRLRMLSPASSIL